MKEQLLTETKIPAIRQLRKGWPVDLERVRNFLESCAIHEIEKVEPAEVIVVLGTVPFFSGFYSRVESFIRLIKLL